MCLTMSVCKQMNPHKLKYNVYCITFQHEIITLVEYDREIKFISII